MSVSKFSILFAIVFSAGVSQAVTGRERPERETSKERALTNPTQAPRTGEVNTTIEAQTSASAIAEKSLQDASCDGACRVSALAVEGLVRNPRSHELSASEINVANEIALDIQANQNRGMALPAAIQDALSGRGIDAEEFNEACAPR